MCWLFKQIGSDKICSWTYVIYMQNPHSLYSICTLRWSICSVTKINGKILNMHLFCPGGPAAFIHYAWLWWSNFENKTSLYNSNMLLFIRVSSAHQWPETTGEKQSCLQLSPPALLALSSALPCWRLSPSCWHDKLFSH